MSAYLLSQRTAELQYLLRELRRLHLRLHDLESDNVPCWPAAIVSFGAMADGETTFSERRAGRIIDSRWLGDNGRWRLSVDGRHCRCRWPDMHKNRTCLRWLHVSMSKDQRWLLVYFRCPPLLGQLGLPPKAPVRLAAPKHRG